MANFRDLTPEQRKAMRAKSQATRDLRMYDKRKVTDGPIPMPSPSAYYRQKVTYLECKIHQLYDDLNQLSAKVSQEKPVRDLQVEVVKLLSPRFIRLNVGKDDLVIELASLERVADPQKDSSLRQTRTATIAHCERVLLNAVEETFGVNAEDLNERN